MNVSAVADVVVVGCRSGRGGLGVCCYGLAAMVALVLFTSCGGRTTSGTPAGTERCSVPNESITSGHASELMRCRDLVEPDAVVIGVFSDSAGEMDEHGRSPRWLMPTWSPGGQQLRWVLFDEATGFSVEEVPDSFCLEPPVTDPASSDVVVPDAIQRVAPLDPYDDKRFTARIYHQEFKPCFEPRRPSPNGVGVVRSTTPDNSVSFYLDYTWSGEFNGICGPCPGALLLQCAQNCR